MLSGYYDITKRPKHEYKGIVLTAQIEWELFKLINIYDSLHARRVLEIGTQRGGTLIHWLEGADPGTVVCNIDTLQSTTEQEKADLPAKWATWAPPGVVYHCLIGRSDDHSIFDQLSKYVDGWLDFLFIDGLHTYDGAKHDFEKYGSLVRAGGVIALHDLVTPDFSPHIQVGKLWREIQGAGYVTRELRAGGEYGGIGVVYV